MSIVVYLPEGPFARPLSDNQSTAAWNLPPRWELVTHGLSTLFGHSVSSASANAGTATSAIASFPTSKRLAGRVMIQGTNSRELPWVEPVSWASFVAGATRDM